MTPTRYRIIPVNPHAHVFEISCTVDDPGPTGQSSLFLRGFLEIT
jgi:hypothetical protein